VLQKERIMRKGSKNPKYYYFSPYKPFKKESIFN